MPDLSPSETLRAAAARLRELASAATEGPWRWTGYAVDVEPNNRGAYVATGNDLDVILDADGQWIATMSPAVAEPLAGWLEIAAAQGMFSETSWSNAMAFARTILQQS